jgi:hypothetical protein
MFPHAARRTIAYDDPAAGPPPELPPATFRPTVAKLAVATAGQLNSLAKMMAPDPFQVQRALQLLHRDTPPLVRTTLRFDGAVAKQF